MTARPVSPWGARIGASLLARFPERPGAWRTLGRESEHPVVHPDGTAADIAVLWPHLIASGAGEVVREGDLIVGYEGPDVQFSAEVGRGTLEIIVGPAQDLHGIHDAYRRGLDRVLVAAQAEGLRVLGYGIQPVTPATPALMTGKHRYQVLLDVLGDVWLSFALTASDQVHASLSREEVVAATNLTNLLAPLTVALCANSSITDGRPAGVCSAREAGMGVIGREAFRHGMVEGPVAGLGAWVERTLDMAHLMHRDGDVVRPASGTFRGWLDANTPDDPAALAAWLYHEHYVWNSARPRAAHGTIELRAACQQPGGESMAAAALGVGLVAAHRELASWLDEVFGADLWPAMRAWHGPAVRDGLAAPPPVAGLVEGVLERVAAGLEARGRGEEVFLEPLWARAASRTNPAQAAVAVWERGGVPALIDHLTVR